MALRIQGGGETVADPQTAVDDDAPAGQAVVALKDRYDIFVERPVPACDAPPALAFHAAARRDLRRSLYALICDPKLPPRTDAIPLLQRIDSRHVIRVVDWGVVDWPPEGRRCPAIVMERPAGGKAFKSLEDVRAPMSDETVTRLLIQPMAAALKDLHSAGFVHRAIRPDNLYFADEDESALMLGQCFATPVALTQPTAFETIASGLCAPGGRGEGGPADDMYALGATILAFLTGKIPCAGMEEEDIVRRKLRQGSYGALIENNRVSLTMMEPLRALLNDDEDERWSIDELVLWASGRRLSPKQQVMPTKASRAFHFAGADYATARELAHGMSRAWDQAAAPIKDGTLDTWLRRSLGEDSRVEAMNKAKGVGSAANGDDDDRLISRVIMALDPEGPVRMREFAANIDGVGSFIGNYGEEAEARRLFAAVLGMGLLSFWFEVQAKPRPELFRHVPRLEKTRTTMSRSNLGFGVERVIYELNPSFPCRSPMFERDYAPGLDHILPALERVAAEEGGSITRLIDRDIAAYLGAHFKRAIGNDLRETEEGTPAESILAQIRILSYLQDTLQRNVTFPALTRICVGLLQPAVEEFHSRTLRDRMTERLGKAARNGRFDALLEIVTDPQERQSDLNGFQTAMYRYERRARRLKKLREDIRNRDRIAADLGGLISSGLAGMLASLGCLIFIAVKLV